MTRSDPSEIAADLRRSRKYAHLCPDTLARIARWSADRHAAPADALKAAKRKLHQAFGAYFSEADARLVMELSAALPVPPRVGPSGRTLREVCLEILRRHASTAERVPVMESFYQDVFARTGPPRSVLDLACGLHPFALPWMDLSAECRYLAFDIDLRLVEAVNRLLILLQRPPSAQACDLLVTIPEIEADVAFLLKSVPCLEQQEKGSAAAIIRALRCLWVVVSFPARSLGGRDKGMVDHYGSFMNRLTAGMGRTAARLDYPSETVYILRLRH